MSIISILVAEDDQNAGFLLKQNLLRNDYHVDLAIDGQAALDLFLSNKYNLCILDIMMPVKDGFELAKSIKNVNSEIPIIFLSARNLDFDKISGFEIGCDDYVTKPYNIEELLYRIKSVLKRNQQINIEAKTLELEGFKIDIDSRKLFYKEESFKLAQKEVDLLQIFFSNANKVIPRSEILKKIWKRDDIFTANSMDVHLSKVRKLLKKSSNIELINIHGYGFKLRTTD